MGIEVPLKNSEAPLAAIRRAIVKQMLAKIKDSEETEIELSLEHVPARGN
jgi:hypothetical protein